MMAPAAPRGDAASGLRSPQRAGAKPLPLFGVHIAATPVGESTERLCNPKSVNV